MAKTYHRRNTCQVAIFFCERPPSGSLSGGEGGSQGMGAKALGMLCCQHPPVPERWNVGFVFIETPHGPAINWTSLSHIFLRGPVSRGRTLAPEPDSEWTSS